MPWKTRDQQEQRYELIRSMMRRDHTVKELCRRNKVSRKTAYKWLGRYQAGRLRGLVDRSRRPRRLAGRTSGLWLSRLRQLRQRRPTWGARKLRYALGKRYGMRGLPAVVTWSRWLKRWGNLGKSLAIDPRNKDAWILKGAALSDLGRVEEAIGCCDKALSIDPQNTQAWFCKGSWLAGLGRDEDAVECCEKALSLDPRHADALFWKGSRLARLGLQENAIRLYDEVLEINPRHAGAWHNKALSLDALNRRREAVNNYRKYLELASPTDTKETAFVRQRIQELERV